MSPSNRRLLLGAAATFVAGLVVHPLLGWEWTAGAGALGGWVASRRGWLAGALGAGASWAVFTAWSFGVDARAVAEMTRVLASIAGGLPPAATVVATLGVGALLGAAGGLFGGALRNIVPRVPR